VQVGNSETTEGNGLNFTHLRSQSKAHNSYMDFDRIEALSEHKNFYIIQVLRIVEHTDILAALVLVSSSQFEFGVLYCKNE
jgi:hypothetical protein